MNILIVDDEANHRLMLRLHLEDAGHATREAENGVRALAALEDFSADAILLDIKMDVMDGLTMLSHLRKAGTAIPVVIISAFTQVKTAVQAIKLGAVDFLTKPVNLDELMTLLGTIEKETPNPQETPVHGDFHFEGVYTESGMGTIIEPLSMVAPTDATVLILGESGTGKELVARSIHLNSPRHKKTFAPVNCAALNENLIETELFGHEKGAFTGAAQARAGKFEAAEGGTVFLDEIAELPLSTQAKLLRVLQEKTFERVGSTKTLKTDVRIITATHRDLSAMVRQGTFREDLYFRINVFPVKLPPLRDRPEELPVLTDHFMKKYADAFGKLVKGASPGFMAKLGAYDFPGNIRELENIIERSVILARGQTLTEDLLPDFSPSGDAPSGDAASEPLDIKDNERELIVKALKQTGGNKSKAAEILGISRRTLYYKVDQYGIED